VPAKRLRSRITQGENIIDELRKEIAPRAFLVDGGYRIAGLDNLVQVKPLLSLERSVFFFRRYQHRQIGVRVFPG
jgi:hypothetical protein